MAPRSCFCGYFSCCAQIETPTLWHRLLFSRRNSPWYCLVCFSMSTGFSWVPTCLFNVALLLYLSHSVSYELLVLSLPAYPLKCHRAIHPPDHAVHMKPIQSFVHVVHQVGGHMSGHQLRRDFAIRRPWLEPDDCWTTAKTVAETLFALASPQGWKSIDWIGSSRLARLIGTASYHGRLFSHFDHL